MRVRTLIVAGSFVGVVATGLAQDTSRAQTPSRAPVTFSEHVAPIVFANCTPCHRPGEAAPFQLLNYRDARPLAKAMAAAAASRVMPPWKPGPSDYPFHDPRGLTAQQIDILQRWAADGAPEGNPAKLPPLPKFTDGWQLGPPDLIVTMAEPYEVPQRGPDVYRNFVLPLNLDRDVWVRAIEFRPSARAVVHHTLFFLDTTGSARQHDAEDPAPGFPGGMGGVRIAGAGRGGLAQGAAQATGSLGGWALGGRALELPDGLAFLVAKGSDLILSTHFHPSGSPQSETSTVGLYFAARPPTQAFASLQLPPVFGVFEGLDIPAGQERYTVKDSFTLPVDVRAFSIGAHAHYLGKEMKLTAAFPDGAVRTLLWIRDWDFSWQERYRFEDFVALPKGTRLDVEISYDNSAANKRNPSRPPARVTWGEESTDEMGSVGLQLVAAHPGELPELQRAYAEFVRTAAVSRPGLRQLLQQRLGRGRAGR
ncbi:MAG TPA: hypothetical protein VGQ37_01215 [Vicinamibacterales bacterium]|jgi:hypothetical protein|nr:hypothetical protein [Vicinamibacterales bacterium]